jgi:hypothetical protein
VSSESSHPTLSALVLMASASCFLGGRRRAAATADSDDKSAASIAIPAPRTCIDTLLYTDLGSTGADTLITHSLASTAHDLQQQLKLHLVLYAAHFCHPVHPEPGMCDAPAARLYLRTRPLHHALLHALLAMVVHHLNDQQHRYLRPALHHVRCRQATRQTRRSL